MLLHVIISIVISINEHEFVVVEFHGGSNKQVFGGVVLRKLSAEVGLIRLFDTTPLQEFSPNNTYDKMATNLLIHPQYSGVIPDSVYCAELTRVPDDRFVDQNGVIRQEVGNDESAININSFCRFHTSKEAENIAVQSMTILQHELDEVTLGRLGQKTGARAQ